MLKPMPTKTDLTPLEWMSAFEAAMFSRDTETIAHYIHHLPIFKTNDEMRECLLLTMDAEALLCDIRNELVMQRNSLQSDLSL